MLQLRPLVSWPSRVGKTLPSSSRKGRRVAAVWPPDISKRAGQTRLLPLLPGELSTKLFPANGAVRNWPKQVVQSYWRPLERTDRWLLLSSSRLFPRLWKPRGAKTSSCGCSLLPTSSWKEEDMEWSSSLGSGCLGTATPRRHITLAAQLTLIILE